MTKDELMLLTIQQLTEYFYAHPECFELEDPDYCLDSKGFTNSTILFKSYDDPNSNIRTVILAFNATMNTISCNIYSKVVNSATAPSVKPDASTSVKIYFKWFNKSYKKFRKLREHLITRRRIQESNEFLQKLHSVFPGTFDDYIFGKPK